MKTFDTFLEDIDHYTNDIQYGDYEGKPFVIFDDWSTIETITAYLNGFSLPNNQKLEKTYLPYGITNLVDYRHKLHQDWLANPDKLGFKFKYESVCNWMLYQQHLATNPNELVSLEDYDFEYGFSDEYQTCPDCNCIICISPSHYGWTPPYDSKHSGYVCDKCAVENYSDDVLEEYANVARNIPDCFDIETLGLVKVNNKHYETGMHEGMNDDPKKVIQLLNKNNIDVWFKVYPSQFYSDFDVYVRPDDLETAKSLLQSNSIEGVNIAANVKHALQTAPVIAPIPGHIVVTDIDCQTGKSKTSIIPQEEFIKGKK